MAVPYGFGVGDFIALGTLAWKVYKCTKGAPDSFQKIHVEVLSLRVVLEEAQETIFKRPLDLKRQQRLKVIAGGCQSVLTDLDNLVLKYESLGAQTKRTWNRLKWGNEDLAELRARLGNNGTVTAKRCSYSTTQPFIEAQLDTLLRDIRNGRRDGSVISSLTVDSLSCDDRDLWRSIRKELEDIGISPRTFEANHDFIFGWFDHAKSTGIFDGLVTDGGNDEVVNNVDQPVIATLDSTANGTMSQYENATSKMPRNPWTVSFWRFFRIPPSDESDIVSNGVLDQGFGHEPDNSDALMGPQCKDQTQERAETDNPVYSLRKALEWPGVKAKIKDGSLDRAFYSACMFSSGAEVLQYLQHGFDANKIHKSHKLMELSCLKGKGTFFVETGWSVLMAAASAGNVSTVQELIYAGADYDYDLSHTGFVPSLRTEVWPAMRTPLNAAVHSSSLDTAKAIIWAGANVNEQYAGYTLLHQACTFPRANAAICRELLVSGATTSAKSGYPFGTPLLLAILARNVDVVKTLLDFDKKIGPNLAFSSSIVKNLIDYTAGFRDLRFAERQRWFGPRERDWSPLDLARFLYGRPDLISVGDKTHMADIVALLQANGAASSRVESEDDFADLR